ncbi:EVE domain-containing protein, partial [Candidatus Bathyarchaeota archaeon]|nr:EVE domain-containing protein [Candidatus Bathyarchaeota archaeon]
AAIFRVSSKPFYDEKQLFAMPDKARELYPWRFKIKPVAIPKEPLEFDSLVPKLEFIERKKVWYTYLQHAIKRISESDFAVIKSAILSR